MSASRKAKVLGCLGRVVLVWVVLIIFAFAMPEFGAVLSGLIEISFHLATGWFVFLSQTLPRVALEEILLPSFLLGLAIVVLCTHGVMRKVMHHSTKGQRAWQWKWTICLVAMPTLLFGICISIQGAVTTTGWLFSEPLNSWHSNRGINKSWARQLSSLGTVFVENGTGRLPDRLLDIAARDDLDSDRKQLYYIYQDPSIRDVPEYWTWLGGVKVGAPGDVPVAFAPRPYRDGTRVVSFLDHTSKECTEEEWQAALARWRQAKEVADRANKPEGK